MPKRRRALDYRDRLARLTELRAYVRAQYPREDASVDRTEIGAKVKQLVNERISAEVRALMRPVSILDHDFEQKIADLPHDEARDSLMEHAIPDLGSTSAWPTTRCSTKSSRHNSRGSSKTSATG